MREKIENLLDDIYFKLQMLEADMEEESCGGTTYQKAQHVVYVEIADCLNSILEEED